MNMKSIEMTEISSHFADALDASVSSDIAVVQEGTIRGYIISPSRYQVLQTRPSCDGEEQQELALEYQKMVAQMQTPAHANAVDRLMAASTAELAAFFSKD